MQATTCNNDQSIVKPSRNSENADKKNTRTAGALLVPSLVFTSTVRTRVSLRQVTP